MSGPALRQVDSHSSIHEAALGEAHELMELMRGTLDRGQTEMAYELACVLLEHWEQRTLAHAQEEEEGLYRGIELEDPTQHDKLVALSRDHELMRRLAEEIREGLASGTAGRQALQRFEAMLLIDLLHNREEERMVASLGRGKR